MFFNSQSNPEKNHIIDALTFELGKVDSVDIRARMLRLLNQIDKGLAAAVAYGLGLHIPKDMSEPLNEGVPADEVNNPDYQPFQHEGSVSKSDALSMANTKKDSIKTRKIAVLTADGVDETTLTTVKTALEGKGAIVRIIAPRLGNVISKNNVEIPVFESYLTAASVLYDAVYVPGGINSVATVAAEPDAVHFLNEAFKHCKAIAADAGAMQALEATYFARKLPEDNSSDTVMREGVIIGTNADTLAEQFINAIAQHRFWEREKPRKVPA